jgi:phosphohistidine phosphatase
MQIYLMRHAQAEEPGSWRGPDRSRPLTDDGMKTLESALSQMRRRKVSGDVLLTSPYERAGQTADAVARELHILETLQCPELAAGAHLTDLLGLVRRHRDRSPLWIVGHMPELALFAARLTGDPADVERGFRPGEILAVDCPTDDAGPAEGRTLWRRKLEDWDNA